MISKMHQNVYASLALFKFVDASEPCSLRWSRDVNEEHRFFFVSLTSLSSGWVTSKDGLLSLNKNMQQMPFPRIQQCITRAGIEPPVSNPSSTIPTFYQLNYRRRSVKIQDDKNWLSFIWNPTITDTRFLNYSITIIALSSGVYWFVCHMVRSYGYSVQAITPNTTASALTNSMYAQLVWTRKCSE